MLDRFSFVNFIQVLWAMAKIPFGLKLKMTGFSPAKNDDLLEKSTIFLKITKPMTDFLGKSMILFENKRFS